MAAIDKNKLREHLDTLPLLEEEKKMWMRVGFYVEASPRSDSSGRERVNIRDSAGFTEWIGTTQGRNLRNAIIAWWQDEKIKPRADEVNPPKVTVAVEKKPGDDLDELEVRRG